MSFVGEGAVVLRVTIAQQRANLPLEPIAEAITGGERPGVAAKAIEIRLIGEAAGKDRKASAATGVEAVAVEYLGTEVQPAAGVGRAQIRRHPLRIVTLGGDTGAQPRSEDRRVGKAGRGGRR